MNDFNQSVARGRTMDASVDAGLRTFMLGVYSKLTIGIAIAGAALVGRALGAGEDERAKRLATSSIFYLLVLSSLFAALLFPSLRWCLELLGAEGETLEMALDFMQIVVPSIPLLGMGMMLGALLRAKGDPKRAMFVTLSGGAAALVLDPLFIFGFDMGILGAATATVCVRAILVLVGLHGVHTVHRMLGAPHLDEIRANVPPFMTIALPAIATQLATPVGNAYVTSAIAEFGDDAVAGWAIVGRILPVAFGVIFALSGAVGPILSQNLGAKHFDRVTQAMRDALVFTLIYCISVWALLAVTSPWIVGLFGATGEAAELVSLFCLIVAGSFLFNGALFVANAAFNNLGFPFYATLINWGRATLGVIPFVAIGKAWGACGVMIGWGAGAVVFGIAAMVMAFRLIATLPAREAEREEDGRPNLPPTANSAFTSGKGAVFGISSNTDAERRY